MASLTDRDAYDLVVVDVEGYEAEVVASLGGITTRYLHLEVSTRARSRSYLHSELFGLVQEQFGEFDILCQDKFGASDDVFYVLLEFTGGPGTVTAGPPATSTAGTAQDGRRLADTSR